MVHHMEVEVISVDRHIGQIHRKKYTDVGARKLLYDNIRKWVLVIMWRNEILNSLQVAWMRHLLVLGQKTLLAV